MASSSSSSPSTTPNPPATTNTTTTTTDGGAATSVAILIGGSGAGPQSTIPVVVWVCRERARQSMNDAWRHTLEYFEFLDDASRWTHLDQLLLRFHPKSLHVGCSESLEASANKNKDSSKIRRRERMMESLRVFLDERQTSHGDEEEEEDSSTTTTACHLHTSVPVDPHKVESAVSRLLLQDADARLAYRGNLQLSSGGLLQKGLALWLRAESLYPPSHGLDDRWEHSCKLRQGVLNSHLVMDRTAASCIHLLPPANEGVASVVGGNAHNNSLYGLLARDCSTNMGRAKLQVWLRQPLIDRAAILHRQEAVTGLLSGVGKDSLRDALKAFSSVDLPQLASVLARYAPHDEGEDDDDTTSTNTKRPLKALYQLYLLSSTQLPQLLDAMESFDHTTSPLLQEAHEKVSKLLAELDRCQGLVEAVLDLDAAPREYLVKPSFSSELQDLYRELSEIQQRVDEELSAVQEEWEAASGDKTLVRLESLADESSWQFRLPDTNAAKLLPTLPAGLGVKMHRVLKNGVYFSTKQLRQLSASYQQVSGDYSRHSKKVVKDAMGVATTYQTVVERAAEVVSTLDVLTALALVAAYSPHGYCKPTITDSEEDGAGIELKGARHPCVELQDDIEYIPNDVSLGFGASSNFLLVTGPNMGGKSTYIRALGAIVCLAQIGSYVPADAATVNICHALLARVGAGDLQERGISTFMAEMLEASSILRTATKRSLIIVDELGRGTSTFDGYGLARAISEYLQQRIGCLTVFATHFHELTRLPGARNCHVTAQKGSHGLTFLYEVRPGPCLESFGIQVAEMANVPAAVIEDAKRKAQQLEHFGMTGRAAKRARDQAHGDQENGAATDASNQRFVQRFCALDLPSILKQGGSVAETKTKLLQLLA